MRQIPIRSQAAAAPEAKYHAALAERIHPSQEARNPRTTRRFVSPSVRLRLPVRLHHDPAAADVPLYAFGPGAAHLSGTCHLTELHRILARVLGFEGFPVPRPTVHALERVAIH